MSFSFTTHRLEASLLDEHSQVPIGLLDDIQRILTKEVVKDLPDFFSNVNSEKAAMDWLDKMLAESEVFTIRTLECEQVIGFLFINQQSSDQAHIGYLLEEQYWGKGYATELLQAFIKTAKDTKRWVTLIGGVSKTNRASSRLLQNLGFNAQNGDGGDVIFYEYNME